MRYTVIQPVARTVRIGLFVLPATTVFQVDYSQDSARPLCHASEDCAKVFVLILYFSVGKPRTACAVHGDGDL